MPGSIRDYVDNVLFIPNSNDSKGSEKEVAWSKDVIDSSSLHHRSKEQTNKNESNLEEEKEAMNNVIDKEIFSTTTATEDDGIPSLTHPMEKRILKKMDMFLIPLMGLLYFLSNLDKSNIGNAEVAGLSSDIGLKGKEYNVCVTVFFGTYVIFDPIGANLLKIVGPHLMMSVCLLCFGAISIGTAWVRNYGDLLAVRLLLGAIEGMIYPAINKNLSVC